VFTTMTDMSTTTAITLDSTKWGAAAASTGAAAPAWFKERSLCVLKGVITRKDASTALPAVLTTLPEGCRPTESLTLSLTSPSIAPGTSRGTGARVILEPNGVLTWKAGGDGTTISLDGVLFDTRNGNSISFLNNYKDYGSGYKLASYTLTGSLCVLTGFITRKDNARLSNGKVALLPQECRPAGRQVFSVNNGQSGSARVDIDAAGNVMLVKYAHASSPHNTLSLDGIRFVVADAQARSGEDDLTGVHQGVRAEYFYFDNLESMATVAQINAGAISPDLVRVEPNFYHALSYSWAGSPAMTVHDSFYAKYTAKLHIGKEGIYKFQLYADDQATLWLDGEQILKTSSAGSTHTSPEINLIQGTHDIQVIFVEHASKAGIALKYSGPDLPMQVIPQAALSTGNELKPLRAPLISKDSAKCLDHGPDGDRDLQMMSCTSANVQAWTYDPRTREIKNFAGKCLEVYSSITVTIRTGGAVQAATNDPVYISFLGTHASSAEFTVKSSFAKSEVYTTSFSIGKYIGGLKGITLRAGGLDSWECVGVSATMGSVDYTFDFHTAALNVYGHFQGFFTIVKDSSSDRQGLEYKSVMVESSAASEASGSSGLNFMVAPCSQNPSQMWSLDQRNHRIYSAATHKCLMSHSPTEAAGKWILDMDECAADASPDAALTTKQKQQQWKWQLPGFVAHMKKGEMVPIELSYLRGKQPGELMVGLSASSATTEPDGIIDNVRNVVGQGEYAVAAMDLNEHTQWQSAPTAIVHDPENKYRDASSALSGHTVGQQWNSGNINSGYGWLVDNGKTAGAWYQMTMRWGVTDEFATTPIRIRGVLTRSRGDYNTERLKTFVVKYSDDTRPYDDSFKCAEKCEDDAPATECDSSRCKIVTGNGNNNDIKYTRFKSAIRAKYVRIYPQTWQNRIAMRAALLLEPEPGAKQVLFDLGNETTSDEFKPLAVTQYKMLTTSRGCPAQWTLQGSKMAYPGSDDTPTLNSMSWVDLHEGKMETCVNNKWWTYNVTMAESTYCRWGCPNPVTYATYRLLFSGETADGEQQIRLKDLRLFTNETTGKPAHFYSSDIVSAEHLRSRVDAPPVLVTTNGVLSSCGGDGDGSGTNCAFEYTRYNFGITQVSPTSANKGDILTIYGAGFSHLASTPSALEVKLGFSDCVVESISAYTNESMPTVDSALTCKVTSLSAGGHTVQVQHPSLMGFADNKKSLTVRAALVVSTIEPAEGSLEGGTVLTITGLGFSDQPFERCKARRDANPDLICSAVKRVCTSGVISCTFGEWWCDMVSAGQRFALADRAFDAAYQVSRYDVIQARPGSVENATASLTSACNFEGYAELKGLDNLVTVNGAVCFPRRMINYHCKPYSYIDCPVEKIYGYETPAKRHWAKIFDFSSEERLECEIGRPLKSKGFATHKSGLAKVTVRVGDEITTDSSTFSFTEAATPTLTSYTPHRVAPATQLHLRGANMGALPITDKAHYLTEFGFYEQLANVTVWMGSAVDGLHVNTSSGATDPTGPSLPEDLQLGNLLGSAPSPGSGYYCHIETDERSPTYTDPGTHGDADVVCTVVDLAPGVYDLAAYVWGKGWARVEVQPVVGLIVSAVEISPTWKVGCVEGAGPRSSATCVSNGMEGSKWGGDVVRITGSGFSNVNKHNVIEFIQGSKALKCTPVSSSMYEIDCVTPDGFVGAIDNVRVTVLCSNLAFCHADPIKNETSGAAGQFAYSSEGRPAVTALSPPSISPGAYLTITGTGFSSSVGELKVDVGGSDCEVFAYGDLPKPTELVCKHTGKTTGTFAVRVTVKGKGSSEPTTPGGVGWVRVAPTIKSYEIVKSDASLPDLVNPLGGTHLRLHGEGLGGWYNGDGDPTDEGCYADHGLMVDMGEHLDMTQTKCMALCEGYRFFALRGRYHCSCQNADSITALQLGPQQPYSKCSKMCGGDLNQFCGGDGHIVLWQACCFPTFSVCLMKSFGNETATCQELGRQEFAAKVVSVADNGKSAVISLPAHPPALNASDGYNLALYGKVGGGTGYPIGFFPKSLASKALPYCSKIAPVITSFTPTVASPGTIVTMTGRAFGASADAPTTGGAACDAFVAESSNPFAAAGTTTAVKFASSDCTVKTVTAGAGGDSVLTCEVQDPSESKARDRTDQLPASCSDLLLKDPFAPSGWHRIKIHGQHAITVYCDMETDGGGYTFYPISNAIRTCKSTSHNSCKALGMDIIIPRTKNHFKALFNSPTFGHAAGYLYTAPGVTKPSSSSVNYRWQKFTSSNPGVKDWKATDGGSWWLHERTDYSEPNGDYSANCWLGVMGYDSRNPVTSLGLNDARCAYCTTKYVCSTNDKLMAASSETMGVTLSTSAIGGGEARVLYNSTSNMACKLREGMVLPSSDTFKLISKHITTPSASTIQQHVATAEECCRTCMFTGGCSGFSYQRSSAKCYLKNKVGALATAGAAASDWVAGWLPTLGKLELVPNVTEITHVGRSSMAGGMDIDLYGRGMLLGNGPVSKLRVSASIGKQNHSHVQGILMPPSLAEGSEYASTSIYSADATPTITTVSPSSGEPGTTLVIMGTALYDTSVDSRLPVITIGGAPCTIASAADASATQITCTTTPPAAGGGSYPVQLWTSRGFALDVDVTARPSPSLFTFPIAVSNIVPSAGSAGGGTLVTITGSGFDTKAPAVWLGTSRCAVPPNCTTEPSPRCTYTQIVCTTGPAHEDKHVLAGKAESEEEHGRIYGAAPLSLSALSNYKLTIAEDAGGSDYSASGFGFAEEGDDEKSEDSDNKLAHSALPEVSISAAGDLASAPQVVVSHLVMPSASAKEKPVQKLVHFRVPLHLSMGSSAYSGVFLAVLSRTDGFNRLVPTKGGALGAEYMDFYDAGLKKAYSAMDARFVQNGVCKASGATAAPTGVELSECTARCAAMDGSGLSRDPSISAGKTGMGVCTHFSWNKDTKQCIVNDWCGPAPSTPGAIANYTATVPLSATGVIGSTDSSLSFTLPTTSSAWASTTDSIFVLYSQTTNFRSRVGDATACATANAATSGSFALIRANSSNTGWDFVNTAGAWAPLTAWDTDILVATYDYDAGTVALLGGEAYAGPYPGLVTEGAAANPINKGYAAGDMRIAVEFAGSVTIRGRAFRHNHPWQSASSSSPEGGAALVSLGSSGCTPGSPCGVCHGDCDSDSDCIGAYKCFQRDQKQAVPGCAAGGSGDVSQYDFCYSDSTAPGWGTYQLLGAGDSTAARSTSNTTTLEPLPMSSLRARLASLDARSVVVLASMGDGWGKTLSASLAQELIRCGAAKDTIMNSVLAQKSSNRFAMVGVCGGGVKGGKRSFGYAADEGAESTFYAVNSAGGAAVFASSEGVLSVKAKMGEFGIVQTMADPSLYTPFNYSEALTPQVSTIDPVIGSTAGGTTITIKGKGFGDSPNVTLAGEVCAWKYEDIGTYRGKHLCDWGKDAEFGVNCSGIGVSDATITCITNPAGATGMSSKPYGAAEVQVNGKGLAVTQPGAHYYSYLNRWSATTTWGYMPPPIEGDMVSIPVGNDVLYDMTSPRLVALIIEGTMVFDDTMDLELNCSYILVKGWPKTGEQGRLVVGTKERPHMHRAVITLVGNRRSRELPMYGAKVLAVRYGIVDMHGDPRHSSVTWSRLNASAPAGSTTVTMREKTHWKAGDEVVIAPTGLDEEEAEQRKVVRVTDGGQTLTLNKPLEFDHDGEVPTFQGRRIENAVGEVGLLTRNVVIQGDDDSYDEQYGCTVMFHDPGGANSLEGRFEHVEVRWAGQGFFLGRYAMHYHMTGNVSKSYVKSCSIYNSFNRALAIHGVHDLKVQKNVAYNIRGHAFFFEDGVEVENVLEDNLAVMVRPVWSLLEVDMTPAAFWGTNPANHWRRNVVAGSTSFGYWFRPLEHPDGASTGNPSCPNLSPLGSFEDNVAHTVGMAGLRIEEYTPHRNGYNCEKIEPAPAIFLRTLVFNSRENAVWLRENSFVTIKGLTVIGTGKVQVEPWLHGPGMFIEDFLSVGNKDRQPEGALCRFSKQIAGTRQWILAGPDEWEPCIDPATEATSFNPSDPSWKVIETKMDFGSAGAYTQAGESAGYVFSNTTFVNHHTALQCCTWAGVGRNSWHASFRQSKFVNTRFRAQTRDPELGGYSGVHKALFRDLDGTLSGVGKGTLVGKSNVLAQDPECHFDPLDNHELGTRMGVCHREFRRTIVAHSFLMQGDKIILHDTPHNSDAVDRPWITGICQEPLHRWTVSLATNRAYEFNWLYDMDEKEEEEQFVEFQSLRLNKGESMLLSHLYAHDCDRFHHTHVNAIWRDSGSPIVGDGQMQDALGSFAPDHPLQGRKISLDPYSGMFDPTFLSSTVLRMGSAIGGAGMSVGSSGVLEMPAFTFGGGSWCFEAWVKPTSRGSHDQYLGQIAKFGLLPDDTNVARGKATTQSSTAHGGVSSRAVDGGTETYWSGGSCTHTNNEVGPWWRVDVATGTNVSSVKIWNRHEAGSRINGVQIRVGDNTDWKLNALCADNVQVASGGSMSFNCNGGRALVGKYVFIGHPSSSNKILTLCEVQVVAATSAHLLDGSFRLSSAPYCCQSASCPAKYRHHCGELLLDMYAGGERHMLTGPALALDTWQHIVVGHDGRRTVMYYHNGEVGSFEPTTTGGDWDGEKTASGLQHAAIVSGDGKSGVSASRYYGISRHPKLALDNDPATYWDSLYHRSYGRQKTQKMPEQWLSIELETPATVVRYTIMHHTSHCPVGWLFQGSMTGGLFWDEWTTLDEVTNPFICKDKEVQTFNDFSRGEVMADFRYYRFFFNAVTPVTANSIRLRDVQLYDSYVDPRRSIATLPRVQRAPQQLGGSTNTEGFDNGHSFFAGTVGSVRFWDNMLSAEEVNAHFSTGKIALATDTSHLLFDYDFDDLLKMSSFVGGSVEKGTTSDCLAHEKLVGSVADNAVLDSALSASSYLDDSSVYGLNAMGVARLGNMLGGGAWCAKFADQQQWVQVEFPPLVTFTIAGVQIQGHAKSDYYVSRFKIRTRHKYDWTWVTVSQQAAAADDEKQQQLLKRTGEASDPFVFTNPDGISRSTVNTHLLRQPIHAEAVRLHPSSWYGANLCLRFEVLGCMKGHVSSSAESVDAAAASRKANSSSSAVGDYSLPNPFPKQSMVVDVGEGGAKVVKWYSLRFDKKLVPRSWELHGSNSSAFDDDTLAIIDRVQLLPHPTAGSEKYHGLELFFTSLNNNGSALAAFPYRYFRFAFQTGFPDGYSGYRVLEYHLYDTDVADEEPALASHAAASVKSYLASPTGATTSVKACDELGWFDSYNSSDGVCAGSELKDGLRMQQLQDPSINATNGWTLLFRQPKKKQNPSYWLNQNTHDQSSESYSSIENSLQDESYAGADGKYTFMMKWPKRRGRNWLSWKQTSNPYLNSLIFKRGVTGYEPIDVPSNPNGEFTIAFSGLEWSQRGALFDGSAGDNWFYAIGTGMTGHTGSVGGVDSIPGPDVRGEEMVELYISKVLHQSCSGNVTYNLAEKLCTSSGARLCTAHEIATDQTFGTGCGYDVERVWSSSSSHAGMSCATGEMATLGGSSRSGIATACVPKTSSTAAAARCCADVDCSAYEEGVNSTVLHSYTFPTRAAFGSTSPDIVGTATAELNEGVQLAPGVATLDGKNGFLDLPIHPTTNAGHPELTVETWVTYNGPPSTNLNKEMLWGFSTGGGYFMGLSPRGNYYNRDQVKKNHHRSEMVFTFKHATGSYHLMAPTSLSRNQCSSSISCPDGYRMLTGQSSDCKCYSEARSTRAYTSASTNNCDGPMAQCASEGGRMADINEMRVWLDDGGDRKGNVYGVSSTLDSSGRRYYLQHQVDNRGYLDANCNHGNRYFVCMRDNADSVHFSEWSTEARHVVVTLQQHGSAVLYVDGVAVDDTARCYAAGRCPSATFDYTTADLGTLVTHYIGKTVDTRGCGTSCGYFNGKINKFALRSKALTACAVKALFDRGLPTPDQALVQVLDQSDTCRSDATACNDANFTGLRPARDTLRVGYQPKHLDYFFEKRPTGGCKLHTVLQGPMNAIKMGPSALCPDEGCPPPPDPDALEARVGLWSDPTLWQAQTNKSYDLSAGGVAHGARRLGEENYKSEWVLVQMEGVPQDGDNAWIPQRWRVTLDQHTNALGTVVIEGTLKWSNSAGDLSLTARMITVRGGYLLIGTQSHAFQDKATITLTGVDDLTSSGLKQYVGYSKQIYDSGTIAIYGETRVTWAKLDATVRAGANVIQVNSPVDWRAGETIVITGGHGSKYEEGVIAYIDPDGLVVTLESALKYDHVSEFVEGVDVRQAVGLLDRNVEIKSHDEGTGLQDYGWSLQTKCVPKKRRWKDAADNYREETVDWACSTGPKLHGVRLHELDGNVYLRPEFGIRVNNGRFSSCTFSDGQGLHSLNKGIYGRFPGGTFEIGTAILTGRTLFKNNFIYRTYGITFTSRAALYKSKKDHFGRSQTGSVFMNNLGIETDMLLTGSTEVRHNAVYHDRYGAALVFGSDGMKCVRRGGCSCEENPSTKKSYNNTAAASRIGIGVLSGCVRDTTLWDNGIGVTMDASTKGAFIRTHFVENTIGVRTRGCYLLTTCMQPDAVTQAFSRGMQVVDSTFVGCRDHRGGVSASGAEVASVCAKPTKCRNVNMGIEHSGMTMIRNVFSRYACTGHVIKSSRSFAPIGGSQPMKIRDSNTTDVAAGRFVSYHTSENICGKNGYGVGGTNGNPVTCDSHSRPIVRDEDGKFFGNGSPGNAVSGLQAWPSSVTTACASELLAERQNCMWWQKVQPNVMEIAQPTMQFRQGIQRHSIDGSRCTMMSEWGGYKCDEKIKYVPIFIEDMVRRGRNAMRRVGPIGFTQVCGFATGKDSRCVDTSAGAKDGGYSDFLAGISRPGPPDFNGDEELTNNFLPVGANMHKYRVDYTGTTPPSIRLSMPFADPTDSITVIVWYSSPMMLTLKDHRNKGLRVADRKTSVWPGRSDPSWFFDRLLNELHVTLTGKNSVRVQTRKVIQVAMTVAVTLEQFYGEGGEVHRRSFVRNVASVLMINPDRIRIVSIVPGNGRRRLLSFEKTAHARTNLRSIRGGSGAAQSRRLAASTKVDFEVAEEDPCKDIVCKNEGTCSQGVCDCEPGFMGAKCEHTVSCGNGISCGATGSCDGSTLECQCTSGYQEQKVLNTNATYFGTTNNYVSGCNCIGSTCGTEDKKESSSAVEVQAFVSEEESLADLQDLSNTFNEKAAAGRVDVGYEMVGIKVVVPPTLEEAKTANQPTGESQVLQFSGPEAWLSELLDGVPVASFTLSFNGETTAPLPVHTGSLTADSLESALKSLSTVGSVTVTQTKDQRHDLYLAPKSVVSNDTSVTAWTKQVELEYTVNFTLAGIPKNQGPQPLIELAFAQREKTFTDRAALAAGYEIYAGDANWTISRGINRARAGRFATGNKVETQLVVLDATTGSVGAAKVAALTFTLAFGGQVTAPLPGNASAANVRVALAELSSLEDAQVEVLREDAPDNKKRTWRVLLYRHSDYLCEPSSDGSVCSQKLPDIVAAIVTTATGTNLGVSRESRGEYPQLQFRDGAAEAALTSSSKFGEEYVSSSEPQFFMNPTKDCGDGVRTTDEGCDDGNNIAGDGCDARCRIEEWRALCNATFLGEKSLCYLLSAQCGDGVRQEGEGCDDGNFGVGDGCNANCEVEHGFECVVPNPVMGQPYGNVSSCSLRVASASPPSAVSSASAAAGIGAGVGISLVMFACAVALYVHRKRQLDAAKQSDTKPEKFERSGGLDAGTSFYPGGSKPKMKKAGGLDAGQSFKIDDQKDTKAKIDFAASRTGLHKMRTETVCDDDDETLREVRGLSLDLTSHPGSSPGVSLARARSDSIQEAQDPSGKTYYYNKYTAKVGWSPEEVTRNPEPKAVSRKGGKNKDGQMGGKTESVLSAVDPSTGKTYFYNQFTQKTGWSKNDASRDTVNKEYGVDGDDGGDGIAVVEAMSNPMFAKRSGMTSKAASKLRLV
jgi:cysteine-rich repeat protein